MANSKISALDQVTSVNGSDVLPIVQGTNSKVTRKVRIDQLPQYAGKVDTTVTDLRIKVSNGQLKPGTFYEFDFLTKHVIPNTGNVINTASVAERILVMAISENKLSQEAYSANYPEDILNIDIISSEATTCEDGSSRDGKITYRKDTKRNLETWYDFRNVRFRRWKIDVSQYNDWSMNTEYSVGDLIKYNNLILRCRQAHNSGYYMYYLWWEKVFFIGDTEKIAWDTQINTFDLNIPVLTNSFSDYLTFEASNIKDVKILPMDDRSYNNIVILGYAGKRLSFGLNCKKITIINGSDDNSFGSGCEEIIMTSSNSNVFGNNVKKVQIYSSWGNIIGNNCQSLNIYGRSNFIGSDCKKLRLQFSSYNQFSSGCSNIAVGGGSDNNVFGPSCFNITLTGETGSGHYCNNSFGPNCSEIDVFGSGNVFESGCTKIYLRYASSNNYFAAGVKEKSFSMQIQNLKFLITDNAIVTFKNPDWPEPALPNTVIVDKYYNGIYYFTAPDQSGEFITRAFPTV